ncbi:MAG: 6-pyruvoyl-tetrahydropterin synthase-related protein [Clostridium sp.]|nr:6-pyruvoyl-tetrahydropterin synthase-related protein [Clostridium sp.]
MQKKKSIHITYWLAWCIIAVVLAAAVALCVGFYLYHSGIYLYGSAVYGQLYKLDIIADSWNEGVMFPLYAPDWYNGYEIFRCTAPAAYFLTAAISYIFGADSYIAICVFYGIMTFVSQMGFYLFGIRHKKMAAAFFTGLTFLLLPATFSAVILEGSLDMVMGLALMPLLLYFLDDFCRWGRRMALLPFSALYCLFILSNYVLSIAFGIVMLVYLILFMTASGTWKYGLAALADIGLLYLVMGYFLYPALSGGLLTRDYDLQGSAEIAFGIPVFAVAVIGLITANRSRVAGFLLAVIAGVLSLSVMEPVMKLISSPVLQKSYWYTLIVTVVLLITLLCWEQLKPLFLVIALVVMTGSNIPALLTMEDGTHILETDRELIGEYLLDEAAACTDNRVALMDMTTLGAFPQWYFTRQDVDVMFGWNYENALTIQNQMSLKEAFLDGFYDYMFDRTLLYGNDTVVILKELLEEGAYDTLIAAANRNGYGIQAENDKAIVLKASAVNGTYGVAAQYENLAIGENAFYIAYIYPSFGYGASTCLEDYTIEELSQYHKLYLSGFTYRDKEKAENMLKELSTKGTEVYIDMQHIPINALTGKNEFMDVYAQFVQFTEDFPVLENDNGNQFKLDFKAGGYAVWDTVYVSGCEDVLKETVYENKSHLVYLGQNHDPNVTFMGFNLLYYYLTTHNQDLKRFLDEALQLSSQELPVSDIVPVQIEREAAQIAVHTQADRVNCNIAGVDALEADRIVSTQENLLVVNQGDTIFKVVYAGQRVGMFLSILGLVMLCVMWIAIYVLLENNETKQ